MLHQRVRVCKGPWSVVEEARRQPCPTWSGACRKGHEYRGEVWIATPTTVRSASFQVETCALHASSTRTQRSRSSRSRAVQIRYCTPSGGTGACRAFIGSEHEMISIPGGQHQRRARRQRGLKLQEFAIELDCSVHIPNEHDGGRQSHSLHHPDQCRTFNTVAHPRRLLRALLHEHTPASQRVPHPVDRLPLLEVARRTPTVRRSGTGVTSTACDVGDQPGLVFRTGHGAVLASQTAHGDGDGRDRGEVTLDRLWHAVPPFPTMGEVWLRLPEACGL